MHLKFLRGCLNFSCSRSYYGRLCHAGKIFRRLREIQGASQSELARFSAATNSYICSVESGLNNISISKILLICNALNLNSNTLLGIEECISVASSITEDAMNEELRMKNEELL